MCGYGDANGGYSGTIDTSDMSGMGRKCGYSGVDGGCCGRLAGLPAFQWAVGVDRGRLPRPHERHERHERHRLFRQCTEACCGGKGETQHHMSC
jgi:hypothetical protein